MRWLLLLDREEKGNFKNLKFFVNGQILSYNQNKNKNSSADWSVWNLRGKAIKTNDFAFSSNLFRLVMLKYTLTRLLRVLGQVKGFFIIGFPREMTQANLFEERVRG